MTGPDSHDETTGDPGQGGYPTAPDATKSAIERLLADEVIRRPETALSFSRIFNRDPGFSRIFSRGGTHLEELLARDIATMDDAAFERFSERLRSLQEMAATDPPEAG